MLSSCLSLGSCCILNKGLVQLAHFSIEQEAFWFIDQPVGGELDHLHLPDDGDLAVPLAPFVGRTLT